MTLGPIKILDLELGGGIDDVPVAEPYRKARVLVRWTGVPLGTIEVPIRGGAVRARDLAAVITRDLVWPIASESVRRALLSNGVPPITRPLIDSLPRNGASAELPSVTVAICTRDRPDDLRVCLDSLAQVEYPECEIIVIDNAPATKATEALAERFFPRVRYVREDEPGLNNARNRAIREARGEIVAFVDDDVVVDRRWVGAIAAVFAGDSTIGLVTGLVEPYELETDAQVLFERYGGFGRGYVSHFTRAPRNRPMPWHTAGAGRLGAGASMAYRRAIFTPIGLFDPALDAGTPSLTGGDHEMFFRVLKGNYGCVYEPAALARHRHRRSMDELSRLLYSYGWGTRCFFESVSNHFPDDSAAIKRLTLWWWRRWGLRRWWSSFWKPGPLPAYLFAREVAGFWHARGAYARIRRQLVPNESTRPDAFQRFAKKNQPLPRTLGVVSIDVSEPVRDLHEGREFDDLHVDVHWDGRPIGGVRMASDGQPVSRGRVADAIAHQLGHSLLRPAGGRQEGWSLFHADLMRLLCGDIPRPEPPLCAEHGATIIVATCDRPQALRRCLRSLLELRTPRSVQIIVVDNRPGSGLTRNVVRAFPSVDLVEEPRPGSSYARNAGIAAAREEIIAMTDDDMIVSREWLEQLLAPLARRDVMAVTGNTLPAKLETQAEQLFETYGGFGRGNRPFEYDYPWLIRSRWRSAATWKLGGTGNAAFRREIFFNPEIGMFDESLGSGTPTGTGEDTKMFYDILHAGGVIVYQPSARAWHHHRVDLHSLLRQLYTYNRGHIAYHLATFRKHRDGRALAQVFLHHPLSFLQRSWSRCRRRTNYPFSLLLVESAGALAGPWGLWRGRRRVRRFKAKLSYATLAGRPGATPRGTTNP